MKRRSTLPAQAAGNDSADDGASGRYQVRALERGLAILSAFDGIAPCLTPAELAQKTRLPKPTVFRLLQVLADAGFVERSTDDETAYRVGARALGLGSVYLSALRVPVLAQPILDRLQAHTAETTMLGVLQRDRVLLLAVSLCRQDVALNAMVGARYEPHCTALGKVLLTGVRHDTLRHLIDRIATPAKTPRTIVSKAALAEELNLTTTRGWALEDEEREPGIVSVAAPVFGENDVLAGALGIAAPKYRVPVDVIPIWAKHVVTAAADLSRQLTSVASVGRTRPQATTLGNDGSATPPAADRTYPPDPMDFSR
jgi:DNA-binding IclR family transcriptional regulator